MKIHRVLTLATVAAVSAPLVAGCSSSGGPAAQTAEGVGHLSTALSATGPDGATYSLPSSTQLQLTATGSGCPAGGCTPIVLMLDGTFATQLFSVPAGAYQATLGNSGQTTFTLNRAGDGGATTANATLTDPQPFNLTVTTGLTTQLAFHFMIQGLGSVTFGTGNINTSIAVAPADGGAPGKGTAQGLLEIAQLVKSPGSAGITNLIQTNAPTTFQFNMGFNLTGPFVAGVDSTCAGLAFGGIPGNVKPVRTPAGGNSGIADLFGEAFGANAADPTMWSGTICLYDGNGYNLSLPAAPGQVPGASNFPNAVVITFTHPGQPLSGTVQAALQTSPDSSPVFTDVIIATPPSPLYDGTTAQFSSLINATSLTVDEVLVEYDPSNPAQSVTGTSFDPSVNGNAAGQTLTLQLSP